MPEITLVEGISQALSYEMAQDESVVALGEDIGTNGGVFRATVGLSEKFGKDRVMDTPLAETMIAGLTVGMALQGLRPVAEFQFMGFIYAGFEHIISHAARFRNRTRGRLSVPAVFRAPYGGGIHAPEHHSESTEALFAHIPGLRVVIPSSPARAYGLLLSAIRCPDPVVFLEPKRIYRLVKQDVPDDGVGIPLDQCFILREGTDVTLVTWGAMTHETLQAADQLTAEGISAEVIDLATISPIDIDTILNSVAKTGRLVVVQEAAYSCSVGGEIIAEVAEKGLMHLTAAPQRVSGYDTIMPYAKMEKHYMPSVERVLCAVYETLAH